MSIVKLIRRATGRTFLMNKRTRQIHRESHETVNCSISLVAPHNKKWLTKKQAKKMIDNKQADGCHWCWREQDKF